MPPGQLHRRAASAWGGNRACADADEVVMVRRSAVAPCVTCGLCGGILRDATTVSECLHSFCRKCIFKKFEDEDTTFCPTCSTDLGCDPLEKLRTDHSLLCIRLMLFPVKRRKVDSITLPQPALVSPPLHLPQIHGVGQSAKKTDAFFMGESMNGEAEAAESLGMELTASPTKSSIYSSTPVEEVGTFIVTVEKERRARAATESTLSSEVQIAVEGSLALPAVASQRETPENTTMILEEVKFYIGRSQSLQTENARLRLREELKKERAEKTVAVETTRILEEERPPPPEAAEAAREQALGAGAGAPGAGAGAPAARRSITEAAQAADVPARAVEVSARAAEVSGGVVAATPAAPAASAEPSRKRKRVFSTLRVTLTVPPLAPTKVLRSDAAVPTRRRSLRTSRGTEGAAVATSGAPPSAVVAAEPQRAATATEPRQTAAAAKAQQTAATAAESQQAAVVASTSPAPVPADSSQATAVEIPDDDVLPPGWDQWASLPTSAPEPQAGALVRRWDDRMVAGRPRHGAEASSSRVGLPASGGPAASPERGRERVDASPLHFAEAQAEQELWEEFRDHGASLNRALNEALRIHSGPAWRVFQELEIRARDRYGALDQMSSELRRLQEQRDALDALVEALRTNDGWLAYRAEALRDHLLELEGRSTEGVSAVEKVRTALIDRDEALQRAREDLAGARTVAAEWEAEVASVRAQLQQDRAALEGARSWQSQAEEKAKEAEELKASLADKVAAVVTAEEQLRQERAALVEARAALERERLAHEKALGQLQQERVALEGARASLKEREDEVSKLDGELIALSISREDQRRSLEEQGATVVGLQQAVEGGRQALEAEKKQVEGLRTALGHATTQAEAVRAAYNSSQQELEELRAAALETCQAVEEGEAQAGSSLASRLRALGGHVSRRMRRALHMGVQKALGVVVSHYLVDFEAVASGYVVPVGVEDEVAMERADALAATAAETLAEDFMDFLFPDAPDAGEPQA